MPPSPEPASPPPMRVRKSEIRPQDTTTSMANQFAETVKKSSAYILKSIGARRPDLRDRLDRAYGTFFRDFNDWMQTSGRRSQRKINEPAPHISLFEEKKRECIEKMDPLMKEFHSWSNADPMLPERFSMDREDSSDEVFDEPVSCDMADQLLTTCEQLSLMTQHGQVRLHELDCVCQRIEDELRHNIENDKLLQLHRILHS